MNSYRRGASKHQYYHHDHIYLATTTSYNIYCSAAVAASLQPPFLLLPRQYALLRSYFMQPPSLERVHGQYSWWCRRHTTSAIEAAARRLDSRKPFRFGASEQIGAWYKQQQPLLQPRFCNRGRKAGSPYRACHSDGRLHWWLYTVVVERGCCQPQGQLGLLLLKQQLAIVGSLRARATTTYTDL